jgi:cytochrome c peroxidase
MDRLKVGMWFLFVTGTVLPFLYLLNTESLPSEFEMPNLSSPKEHIWKQVILPLPTNVQNSSPMSEIGKIIWFDTAITPNKEGACEACHKLANNRPAVCFEVPSATCNTCHVAPTRGSGGDGLSVYRRSDGKNGTRNTPTVWNSRFNIGYGWEARGLELSVFIKTHLGDTNITGVTQDAFVDKINKDPNYRKLFAASPALPITADMVSNALGEFVRTLVSSNSRFDLYLGGNKEALSEQELKGYDTFRKKGCVICHNGVNIGGNSFKTFGQYKLHKLQDKIGWYELLDNTFEDENLRRGDKGAFALTGLSNDQYLFRVGSLRNVELNRPYFTQGQVWSLDEAIRTMGRVQLGIDLTNDEISALRAFLGSLSGVIPVMQPPVKKEF